MTHYFRAQAKGITIEEMREWNSDTGDDDDSSEGIACTMSPDGLDGGSPFGGAWDALNDDDEIVVFAGTKIERLYDGYLVAPTAELARFSLAEWEEMLEDGSAWEWEEL